MAVSAREPIASPASRISALNIDDITCPITRQILIEPVRISCTHLIERLALAKLLRGDNRCPICRAIITSAVPDDELAKKIQKQFVEVSEENSKTFEEQKRAMAEESSYDNVRHASIMPARAVRLEGPVEMSLEDIRLAASFDRPNPRVRPPISARLPTDPFSLYNRVLSSIAIDNLLQAERIADAISSLYYINKSYNEIAKAHIKKADNNISNLEDATRICNKISRSNLKDTLFTVIAIKYAEYKKYSKAFQSVNKTPNFVFRFLTRISISLIFIVHSFLFILKGLFWPIRVLRARLRS